MQPTSDGKCITPRAVHRISQRRLPGSEAAPSPAQRPFVALCRMAGRRLDRAIDRFLYLVLATYAPVYVGGAFGSVRVSQATLKDDTTIDPRNQRDAFARIERAGLMARKYTGRTIKYQLTPTGVMGMLAPSPAPAPETAASAASAPAPETAASAPDVCDGCGKAYEAADGQCHNPRCSKLQAARSQFMDKLGPKRQHLAGPKMLPPAKLRASAR